MSSPISGFTAIPNPQMLAFMPIQSYLMMYFAGSGWQYGKRKISAMSNEQFNAMTPEGLLQQHSIELKNMLPTLDKTLNDVSPLIATLIEQYGDFIREAIKAIPQAVTNIFQPATTIGGGGTQTQGLAFAKIQLQQYIDQLEQEKAGSEQTEFSASKQKSRKQRVDDINIRNAMAKSADRAKAGVFGNLKPQLALGTTRKRKAGHSQKLERILLIKQISDLGKSIRLTSKSKASRSNPKNKARIIFQKTQIMKQKQQMLINLQARYSF